MFKSLLGTGLLALAFGASAVDDPEKKKGFKIGDDVDDIPCTCVFNKNRMWNPEIIMWNGEEWTCSQYREDGTCAEVALVAPPGEVGPDPCAGEAVPLRCVFNLDNAPKAIEVEGTAWQCVEYGNDGQCVGVGPVNL